MKVDALRYVPASFDAYQARVPGGGFQGNDYAVAITKREAQTAPPTLGGEQLIAVALRYPNTWCVIHSSQEWSIQQPRG